MYFITFKMNIYLTFYNIFVLFYFGATTREKKKKKKESAERERERERRKRAETGCVVVGWLIG